MQYSPGLLRFLPRHQGTKELDPTCYHCCVGDLDGLTPLAAGREAEVFLRPDGSVLKLMRSPEYQSRVEREAAALETLAGGGRLAPRLVDVVTIAGRPGLVLEQIAGTDLLTLLARQ